MAVGVWVLYDRGIVSGLLLFALGGIVTTVLGPYWWAME